MVNGKTADPAGATIKWLSTRNTDITRKLKLGKIISEHQIHQENLEDYGPRGIMMMYADNRLMIVTLRDYLAELPRYNASHKSFRSSEWDRHIRNNDLMQLKNNNRLIEQHWNLQS